jgi:hypothetical protein
VFPDTFSPLYWLHDAYRFPFPTPHTTALVTVFLGLEFEQAGMGIPKLLWHVFRCEEIVFDEFLDEIFCHLKERLRHEAFLLYGKAREVRAMMHALLND